MTSTLVPCALRAISASVCQPTIALTMTIAPTAVFLPAASALPSVLTHMVWVALTEIAPVPTYAVPGCRAGP